MQIIWDPARGYIAVPTTPQETHSGQASDIPAYYPPGSQGVVQTPSGLIPSGQMAVPPSAPSPVIQGPPPERAPVVATAPRPIDVGQASRFGGGVTPSGYVLVSMVDPRMREGIREAAPYRFVEYTEHGVTSEYIYLPEIIGKEGYAGRQLTPTGKTPWSYVDKPIEMPTTIDVITSSGTVTVPIPKDISTPITVTIPLPTSGTIQKQVGYPPMVMVGGVPKMWQELSSEQQREYHIQQLTEKGPELYARLPAIEKVTLPLAVGTLTPNAIKLWSGILTRNREEYSQALYRQLATAEYTKGLTGKALEQETGKQTLEFFTQAPLGVAVTSIVTGAAGGAIVGKLLPAAAKWGPTASIIEYSVSHPGIAAALPTVGIAAAEGVQAVQLKEAGYSTGEIIVKTAMDIGAIGTATKVFKLTFPKSTITPVSKTRILSESESLVKTDTGKYAGRAITYKGEVERGLRIGGRTFNVQTGGVEVTTVYSGTSRPVTKVAAEEWLSEFVEKHAISPGVVRASGIPENAQLMLGKEQSISSIRVTFPRGGGIYDVMEYTGVKSASEFLSQKAPSARYTRTIIGGETEGEGFTGSIRSFQIGGEKEFYLHPQASAQAVAGKEFISYGQFAGGSNVAKVIEKSTVMAWPGIVPTSAKPYDVLPSIIGSVGAAGGAVTTVGTIISSLRGPEVTGVSPLERISHRIRIPAFGELSTKQQSFETMQIAPQNIRPMVREVPKEKQPEKPKPTPRPPISATSMKISTMAGTMEVPAITGISVSPPITHAGLPRIRGPKALIGGTFGLPFEQKIKKQRKGKKLRVKSYFIIHPVGTTKQVFGALFGKRRQKR